MAWTTQDSKDLAEATRRLRRISRIYKEVTGDICGVPPNILQVIDAIDAQMRRERLEKV